MHPEILAVEPLDQLRDFIAEHLALAQSHLACAIMFNDISDDTGMAYSVKAGTAHFRAVVHAANQITEQNKASHDTQERRESPATEGRPL